MAEAKKFTRKQALELLGAGYITQENYDAMIADGKIAAGSRVSSGTVLGMYNEGNVLVTPSLYFKNNKGGIKSFTLEMKELQSKVKSLITEYCEEIKVEAESLTDAVE